MSVLDIQVKVDPNLFGRELLQQVANRVNVALDQTGTSIRPRLVAEVDRLLRNSPEGQALRGQRLQGELGPVEVDDTFRELSFGIIRAMRYEAIQRVAVVGDRIQGRWEIGFVRDDLAEALSIPGASFVSQGGQVPWLSWLLTGGTKVLVNDYQFLGGNRKGSRTGLGIMISGSGWRVPGAFAGTRNDNWLIRALRDIGLRFEVLLEAELQRRLS